MSSLNVVALVHEGTLVLGEVALEAVEILEGGRFAVLAGDDGRRGEADLDLLGNPERRGRIQSLPSS